MSRHQGGLPPRAPGNRLNIPAHNYQSEGPDRPQRMNSNAGQSDYNSNAYGSSARLNGQAYDLKSQQERTKLSQAVNQAIGRTEHLHDGQDDVLSRAAGLSGAPGSQQRSKNKKLEPLLHSPLGSHKDYASQGAGTKSMADILSTKLEQDEEEEMEIFKLQRQLGDIQGTLQKAKFKYEQRQLYELEKREKELQGRLSKLRDLQKEKYNYDSLTKKIREQKSQIQSIKVKE